MVLILVSSDVSLAKDDKLFLWNSKYNVSVDLNKPVPKKVVLSRGQVIAFENNSFASVSAIETDQSGPMFHEFDLIRRNLVAKFRPIRSGKGKITITYHVQAVGHKPQPPAVIEVFVPEDVVTIDVTDGFPKDIEILIGQSIRFISKKKTEFKIIENPDPQIATIFELSSGNLYLAKPWGSYFEFDSIDKGNGSFAVAIYDDDFDLLENQTISVTVK